MEPFEKFNYAQSVQYVGANTLLVHEGHGFVSMDKKPDGYAAVADLRTREKPGTLLSAGLFATLRDDQGREALVMVRRSADARFEPNKIQIPSGRCSHGEAPWDTAIREFFEEVTIESEGAVLRPDSESLSFLDGGMNVIFTPADKGAPPMNFNMFVYDDESCNTLEFIRFVDIRVKDLDATKVVANEYFHTAELVRREDWEASIPQMVRATTVAVLSMIQQTESEQERSQSIARVRAAA